MVIAKIVPVAQMQVPSHKQRRYTWNYRIQCVGVKAYKCALENKGKAKWITQLWNIPEPLNDEWGQVFVKNLFPRILKHHLPEIYVNPCDGGGSALKVNFILELPSGRSLHVTGWPDFSITEAYFPSAVRTLQSRSRSVLRKKN